MPSKAGPDPDDVLDSLSATPSKCWICRNQEARESLEARVVSRLKAGKPIVWTALHAIYHHPEQYGLDLPRIPIKDPRAFADHIRVHAGIQIPGEGRAKNR